ncbi:MAG TPA: CHAD domain-containing protein [Phycisphaerales bacterium]|nr:CHAD domain-containing protein [Phycisphaerales bacterium]HRQ74311.1 CHAD domain-containing protein [Phycisphaerales bacterium]
MTTPLSETAAEELVESPAAASSLQVDELRGDTAIVDAARVVLHSRLRSVIKRLKRVGAEAETESKAVHQLRVATRRAEAAFIVFREAIDRTRFEKMRRSLRRIRRAAGEARRCDVNAERFALQLEAADAEHRDVLQYLLAHTLARRAQAQQELNEAANRYGGKRFARQCDKAVASLHAPKRIATLTDAARETLPRLFARVARLSAGELDSIQKIHKLRRRGKRFRYALEVFSPCVERTAIESMNAIMESMQEKLGAINDCYDVIVDLRAHIKLLRDEAKAGDEAAGALHEDILELKRLLKAQRVQQTEQLKQWLAECGPAEVERFLTHALGEKALITPDAHDPERVR